MNGEDNRSPMGSRFDESQRKGKYSSLYRVLGIILFMVFLTIWLATDYTKTDEQYDDPYVEDVPINEKENKELTKEDIASLKEKIQNSLTAKQDEKKEAEEETGTVDFFYKRAVEKEKNKDYKGAVKDYGKTIELAKKYSSEMWNSLNNRGIINAEQFKDYRSAKKDFSKIIRIENNRYDSEINEVRLEAGYTNRAYVRNRLGDNEGACEDLYDALGLGIESSTEFIEKQIDAICN